MSDTPEPEGQGQEDETEAIRSWLKRSLAAESSAPVPDILRGVQRRIRRRSRGKFFADGWSVGQGPTGHILIGLATLILVAIAYIALGPWDVR